MKKDAAAEPRLSISEGHPSTERWLKLDPVIVFLVMLESLVGLTTGSSSRGGFSPSSRQ